MRKKTESISAFLMVLCLLAGCGSPAPASEEQAAAPAASSAASVQPEAQTPSSEPVSPEPPIPPASDAQAPVADEAPSSEMAAIVVAPPPPPELPAHNADGTIEVSDDVYRDIVSRTLMTAEALKSGEPIFEGIEELLARSPDYVVDIQGMQMNLERRDGFFEKAEAGTPDNILMIVLSDNEDAPVMVEIYHYAAGTEFSVQQVFAQDGKIVRKDETRPLPA